MSFSLVPRPGSLSVENLAAPIGLDETSPRFSWQLIDHRIGAGQNAYQIEVRTNDDVVWDSGKIDTRESVLVPYAGPSLAPHTRYIWRVRIWDPEGQPTQWSEPASFETGFLAPDRAWPCAKWIRLAMPATGNPRSAPCFRKRFNLAAKPQSARLYITARGLFEPWLNGMRVGCDQLTPGWTDYRKRLEYLTYDVTATLLEGENVLGSYLADGWHSGYVGWSRAQDIYGESALLATLRVVEADGSIRWIGTDDTWLGTTGPILAADLQDGEIYDARLESSDWCTPTGADTQEWNSARVIEPPAVPLAGKAFPPIRVIEERPALVHTEPELGRHVFDFGQNLVGVVRIRIHASAGTRIVLRHGEMTEADGRLYVANLRDAKATDVYFCRGGGDEVYEPRFTFHGFRYVEVGGLSVAPALKDVTALVWHTDMPRTGDFSTSDPLLNQLQSNIVWGQRGNFLDVPTDCPQRNERLGWTGDAQVFAPTAAYNYDVSGFFRKWMRDVVDGQDDDGAFPDTAPNAFFRINRKGKGGNAAWAEAGIICPWTMYRKYGDKRILEENYPAMVRYLDYMVATAKDFVRPDTNYGDWLAPDAARPQWAPTPCDLIGTAYFARSAELMAKIARVLGRGNEAACHDDLHGRVVSAFRRHFVSDNGRVVGDTQTAYLLALAFDLLPEEQRPVALFHLERALGRRDNYLATGFVGTPLLCPVLTRFGRADLAYQLLFNEGYPSWLYTVRNGATTMWERWNSWTPENGFGEVGMNSFNHYAYGAIGEWLYASVGGIEEIEPGYRRVLMRPFLTPRLANATAALESPYGCIRSLWRRTEDGQLAWRIELPPGVEAVVVPPCADLGAVLIDENPWSDHLGASACSSHDGRPAFSLLAGRYMLSMPALDVSKPA